MRHSIETIKRVYDDDEGVFLQIAEDADALSCVELSIPDKKSRDYYGDIRFAMNTMQARLVAEAMIAMANEIDARDAEEKKSKEKI